MRNLLVIVLLVTITMAAFAQHPARRKTRSGPTQLCGTVHEVRGNRMPGPAKTLPGGTPVVREVLVYPVMSLDSVTQDDGGFFNNITAKPIVTVKSDKAGKFCVQLPAGTYSVLVRELKGLYANLFDTKNRINAITVQPGKTATMAITISHSASF